MVDLDRRQSHEGGSLPYSRRVSETGSYRSTGSTDGRRSTTPTGGMSYASMGLERRQSGSLRQQLSRRQSGEEPDVVLASVTSKVSLAKQAMQQLTAELAELTGPGQSPPPQGLQRSPGSGSLPPSAFATAAAAGSSGQMLDSRSSSRQGSVALNVLGQPVNQHQHAHHHQQQQQHPGQPHGPGRNAAWSDYKNLWQQERQHRPGVGAAPLCEQESWHAMPGHDMPVPVYQQQQYGRQFRVSTGSLSPSGMYTPSGMMSPSLSPRASAAMMGSEGMSSMGMPGMPVNWPRLRGVFGNGVLSTEELVALYADSGAASEKKLISLLEDALAAAHAEKVGRCADCCAGRCTGLLTFRIHRNCFCEVAGLKAACRLSSPGWYFGMMCLACGS